MNKLLFFKIFIFSFLSFIFFLKGVIFLDPDLGWHIRYGQIILSSGFPSADPFSYTMPSYNYANHEWLTDVIFTLLYPLGNLTLLSLLLAILTTLTIFLSVPKPNRIWHWGVVFLSSTILLSFAGIRPQILSWLFFIVVLKIIQKKHYLSALPLIFLIWANLHAGFVMGLLMLFIYIFSKLLSGGKVSFKEFTIFTLSVLVTLINPYQLKLWQEIWLSISDLMLRRTILEWYPLIFSPNPLTIIWFSAFIFIFIKYRNYLTLFEKIFYPILFLMGISSSRNVPFLILASTPILTTFLEKYYLEFKGKIPNILYGRIPISILYLFLAVFLLSVSQMFTPSHMESFNYPADAISFLKKQPFEGEMFAPYNFGGYLIWQYPQKRVFIDGRMPSWRQEKIGESNYALGEYLKVFSQPAELDKIFNKYQIRLVLWPNQSGEKITFAKKLLNRWQSIFIIKYSDKGFIKTLENSGWKKIYSDDVAVIYEK